jgi:preprotein translocase subunit SecF
MCHVHGGVVYFHSLYEGVDFAFFCLFKIRPTRSPMNANSEKFYNSVKKSKKKKKTITKKKKKKKKKKKNKKKKKKQKKKKKKPAKIKPAKKKKKKKKKKKRFHHLVTPDRGIMVGVVGPSGEDDSGWGRCNGRGGLFWAWQKRPWFVFIHILPPFSSVYFLGEKKKN